MGGTESDHWKCRFYMYCLLSCWQNHTPVSLSLLFIPTRMYKLNLINNLNQVWLVQDLVWE